jgi:hypothetical protein
VQENINKKVDELFHYDKQDGWHAFVCTFCDEYLLCAQDRNFVPIGEVCKNRALFEWTTYVTDVNELRTLQVLVDAYTFNDRDRRILPSNLLQGLCLSPRGVVAQKNKKSKWGLSCCNKCKNTIKPKINIYNNKQIMIKTAESETNNTKIIIIGPCVARTRHK